MSVDHNKAVLKTKATASLAEYQSSIDDGIMGYVARTGKYVNVANLKESTFFDEARHSNYQGTGKFYIFVYVRRNIQDRSG